MLQIAAWHDRNLTNHQQQCTAYGAQGYRALSLSVYNTPQNPLYACVLIRRPQVVAEEMYSYMNQAQFETTLGQMAGQRMAPHIVSATGPAGSELYAASFIQVPAGSHWPATYRGLSPSAFTALNQQMTTSGMKLVWFDCYGTPANEQYVAVWWPDPEMLAWNCDGVGESSARMQQRFDGLSKIWARLAQFVITPGGNVTSFYTDGYVGGWVARPFLSSADYQTMFNQQTSAGLVPLRVCATTVGGASQFAAVFGQTEETTARTFRAHGPTSEPAVDAVMSAFMQAQDIRSASLAVVAGTRLVYVQGYTWAPPNFPDVQPTTLFRQASCSKIFVAYALYVLMQRKRDALPLDQRTSILQMFATTKLQSVLHLTQPQGKGLPADPKFADITLLDLLTSTSGLDQNLIYSSQAAAAAAGRPLPATRLQLAEYVAAQKFTATPGDPSNVVYGNLDYFLLSTVVSVLGGAPNFEAALQSLVCKPLQLTRVREAVSLIGSQQADEAIYELTQPPPSNQGAGELTAGASLRSPDQPLVPTQYGAFDWEMFAGCGGLSVAVTDLARVIASLSLLVNNPALEAATITEWLTNAATATKALHAPPNGVAHGYHGWDWVSESGSAPNQTFQGAKGGSLPGTGTEANFSTGGYSYIAFSANQGRPGVTVDWYAPLLAITPPADWATQDLFHTFGMPNFNLIQEGELKLGVPPELLRSKPAGKMVPPLSTSPLKP